MSSFKSLCFFITSFFPLWIAILIEEIKSICENDNYVVTEWIMIVCILLSFGISFLTVVFSFKNAKKKKRTNARYTLAKITKQKSITAEYVLAYIVPLIAFDFTHWDGVLIFGILFSILTFLCLKHSYFSVNPLLEFKYRFFLCELKDNDGQTIEKIVISKESLPSKKGEVIELSIINNEYSLDVGKWDE